MLTPTMLKTSFKHLLSFAGLTGESMRSCVDTHVNQAYENKYINKIKKYIYNEYCPKYYYFKTTINIKSFVKCHTELVWASGSLK